MLEILFPAVLLERRHLANYYPSNLAFQKGTSMKQYDVEYFRIAVFSRNLSKTTMEPSLIPLPGVR